MNRYRFSFQARRMGAIGTPDRYVAFTEGETASEARLALYERFEHISIQLCQLVAEGDEQLVSFTGSHLFELTSHVDEARLIAHARLRDSRFHEARWAIRKNAKGFLVTPIDPGYESSGTLVELVP